MSRKAKLRRAINLVLMRIVSQDITHVNVSVATGNSQHLAYDW